MFALEGSLQTRERAAADSAVGILALHTEAGKDGGPVCDPSFVFLEVRLGDEGWDAVGELVDEVDGVIAALDAVVFSARDVSMRLCQERWWMHTEMRSFLEPELFCR